MSLKMLADNLFLATTSKTDGSQIHWLSDEGAVITVDGVDKSPAQVAWFLENEKWEDDVVSACSEPRCVTHLKLGEIQGEEAEEEAADDRLLKLVEKTSVTLADLYRRGKARGLLAPRTDYR